MMEADDAKTAMDKINLHKSLASQYDEIMDAISNTQVRRDELAHILLNASSEAWHRETTRPILEQYEHEYMELEKTIVSLRESRTHVKKEHNELADELHNMGYKRDYFAGEMQWVPDGKNTVEIIVLWVKEKISSIWK